MAVGPERPADPQLAGWYDGIAAVRLEARRLVEGLSPAQLGWRPAPGKWSILECLDHLSVTAGKAAGPQLAAIERARSEGRTGTGPFRLGLLGGWFVRSTGPDPKRPMPGPAVFAPGSDHDAGTVVARFEAAQNDLQRLFASADGLDLSRIKARSAASALLRINLAAWFASTVGHQRRHLQQIARIKADARFPQR